MAGSNRSSRKSPPPLQVGPPVNGQTIEIPFEAFQEARLRAAKWSGRDFDWDGNPILSDVSDDDIRKCLEAGLVGVDPAMLVVMDKLNLYSYGHRPVLITGETGTGKEVAARCIHQLGPRKELDFVAVNCVGLPESLIEDLLFGHMKGAFSGAVEDTTGLVKAAGQGTLFLDEIGEVPSTTQAKLLRFVETGEYIRLGSSKVLRSEARIIAATNKDLEQAIKDREFRRDLYERLAGGGEIALPPVFLRLYDFTLLIYRFVREYNLRNGTSINSVSEGAIFEALMCRWPGNVRSLERAVERGCDLVRRKSGHCLQKLDIPEGTLVGLGSSWYYGDLHNFVDGSFDKEVALGALPVYDPLPFLELLDGNFTPETRRRWTFPLRKSIISREHQGNDPRMDLAGSRSEDAPAYDPIAALVSQGWSLPDIEEKYIARLKAQHGSNISAIARQAGVHRDKVKRLLGQKQEK